MRADATRDTCIRMYLDAPTDGLLAVDAPGSWGVNHIIASQGTDGCLDGDASSMPHDAPAALEAKGWVGWRGRMLYPCTLDFEVEAVFEPVAPWLAAVEVLSATAVAVEGGCF